MEPIASTLIDLAEAAYDLEVDEAEWLPRVLNAGLPILDHGLGVVGGVFVRPPNGSEVTTQQIHVAAGPADFAIRQAQVAAECPPEIQQACTRPGICITLSEAAGEKHAFGVESWTRHHDYAKDALGLSAVDPDGQGTMIIAPLRERTTLKGRDRHRWQMIGAHLTTGFRLRQSLKRASDTEASDTGLPYQAEAVLDPSSFALKDAFGAAQTSEATTALREAAVLVDRARGRLRRDDPDEALALWKSLTEGRWSMVDWFDSDDRRFVLAIKNPPGIKDPRGLSTRESQVATYAALGESQKLICYRLGLSSGRVSTLLQDAMRKLGAKNHLDLVVAMSLSSSAPDP